MVKFDHFKLAKRDLRELKKYRSCLASISRGEVVEVAIEHESDGSCCMLEAWPDTLRRIVGSIQSDTLILGIDP